MTDIDLDPPGLDAAIEAAVNSLPVATYGPKLGQRIGDIVRAAAPALRAGALREAADQVDLFGADPGMVLTAGTVAKMLRERADRIGGAT